MDCEQKAHEAFADASMAVKGERIENTNEKDAAKNQQKIQKNG